MDVRPVVALVATPKFKQNHKKDLSEFAYEHLYTLTKHFKVISTGQTHNDICVLIDQAYAKLAPRELDLIAGDFGVNPLTEASLENWSTSIKGNFIKKNHGVEGMIEVANELIQGRLDAVIQFSVEDDTTVRAGSAVLRREANVHDVPIASDIATAHSFVRLWKTKLASGYPRNEPLFRRRLPVKNPFAGLEKSPGNQVLALIAHDGRKSEMCRFVMRYSKQLLWFGHILATGHSGELAKQCLGAAGWSNKELKRILPCNSGPKGGDVQIAAAVIQGLCHNVIFFQDPAISHPHEADIRLFEQAILSGTKVRLASNAESARILLETMNP